MFTVFWFIIALFLSTYSIAWLIENNGSVVVNWLGYEMQTDVLTIILLTFFLTLLLIFLVSIFTRILAIKFPALLKFFFKRNYTKSLEKIIKKYHKSFDDLSSLLLALEVSDKKYIDLHYKNLAKNFKHKKINDFFQAKIAINDREFDKAVKLLSNFSNNHANIIKLKAKFAKVANDNDETRMIAYGMQLVRLDRDFEIAKKIIILTKKHQLWRDVNELIELFGEDLKNFLKDDELLNSQIAKVLGLYQKRNFLQSYNLANKLLLKDNTNSLLMKIVIKSMIKIGFRFCVTKKIKKFWLKNPQLFLCQMLDLNYRKFSPKIRLKLMEKFLKNSSSNLKNIALGQLNFKLGNYQQAINILEKSLATEVSFKAYQIIAYSYKMLEDNEKYIANLNLAKQLKKS